MEYDDELDQDPCEVLGHMPEPEIAKDVFGERVVMQVRCRRCGQMVVGYE